MKSLFTILFLSFFFLAPGQDLSYATAVVDTLSAPGMHGRGYVNEGDKIAASFIASEFEKAGLEFFNVNYYQSFSLPINTFPDSLFVTLGERELIPGKEFVVKSNSPGISGSFYLIKLMHDSLSDPLAELKQQQLDLKDKVVITDFSLKELNQIAELGAAGYIFLVDKVSWHVSQANEVKSYFTLEITNSCFKSGDEVVDLAIQNKFVKNYRTQNVIGFIKGSKHPDKYIGISAHYDHLGRMGHEVFFPGANDNASGTAMLLDLVKYYVNPDNRPEKSMVFFAFSAEEAGLIGSSYYVTHPLFPLEKMEFLLNLDMVGSGSEGIKVVNGAVYEKAFKKLQKLNDKSDYLVKVAKRGEAANSDHFPFYYKGVPSFFIYTLGPECKEYHNIYDTPENVPFTEYSDFFALLTEFIKSF